MAKLGARIADENLAWTVILVQAFEQTSAGLAEVARIVLCRDAELFHLTD